MGVPEIASYGFLQNVRGDVGVLDTEKVPEPRSDPGESLIGQVQNRARENKIDRQIEP